MSLNTSVRHLVVFEVLFEFEGLVTIRIAAHIFSVWKLNFYYNRIIAYMGSYMSFQVSGLAKETSTLFKGAMKHTFVT